MVVPSVDFWRGKRVLVTGHTGFKGAWLSLWLNRLGAKVSGLSLPPVEPSLFTAAGIEPFIEGNFVDIRELDSVRSIVERLQPEVIFHLAAQSLVRPSYREPVETFATNVMGTVHILSAASAVKSVRSIVVVTSDKCYENQEWLWAYRECEPMGGHDPYSSSKGCAELVAAAWRNSFGETQSHSLGIATARAGNVIGGGDWAADRLIPDCIRAIAAGKPIGVRNPASTRPWQHVLDPLCGYLLLAERLTADPKRYAGGWNFGPLEEDAQPVAKIADIIVGAWGEGAQWTRVNSDDLHEAHYLKVDASKARALLHWSSVLRIKASLDWTVEWYKKFIGGHSALKLAEEQIDRYSKLGMEANE